MTFDEWFISHYGPEPKYESPEWWKWIHDGNVALLAWHAALREEDKKK